VGTVVGIHSCEIVTVGGTYVVGGTEVVIVGTYGGGAKLVVGT
jgi:hypothetical protein